MRPASLSHCLDLQKKTFLQGCSIERLDVSYLNKAAASSWSVSSYENTQASEQQTLDLHNVTLAERELIWSHWAVVSYCHTGASHWGI